MRRFHQSLLLLPSSIRLILLGRPTRQLHNHIHEAPDADNDAEEEDDPGGDLDAQAGVAVGGGGFFFFLALSTTTFIISAIILTLCLLGRPCTTHPFLLLPQRSVLSAVVECTVVEEDWEEHVHEGAEDCAGEGD